MDRKALNILQHEPLRVPAGWKDQDRALVIQIDRILDDVYKRLGKSLKGLELTATFASGVADLASVIGSGKKLYSVTVSGQNNLYITGCDGTKAYVYKLTSGSFAAYSGDLEICVVYA